MATLSTQRNRKPQAAVQTLPPREMSPSPTFRDRQRAAKTQSIPLTSSVMQMYQNQQPSPPLSNGSHQSRRSPPPSSSQVTSSSLLSPEPLTPPPASIHSHNQTNIHQGMSTPAGPQHSHSLPNIHSHNPQIGYPRPINRMPPQFLTSYENWAMSEELIPDPQHVATGTAGVAYAGGAVSSGYSRHSTGSPPKDQGGERTRLEKNSPKDADNTGRRPVRSEREREQTLTRESPNPRDREWQTQPRPNSPSVFPQTHSPERRPSSPYHSPLGTPSENAPNYTQYKREGYSRIPTPPLRRSSNAQMPDTSGTTRATPPALSKLSSHTPPLHAIKARSPDRSLPVQEEPEEDVSVSNRDRDKWSSNDHIHDEGDAHDDDLARLDSPTPSSDLHPEGHTSRFDSRGGMDNRAEHRDDDDETLIEQGTGDRRSQSNSRESEEDAYTPRSPSTTLPDENQDRSYVQNTAKRLSVRAKPRTGVTDQLGLRGLETAVYEQMASSPKPITQAAARSADNDHGRRRSQTSQLQPLPQYNWSDQGYAQYQPPPFDELERYFDDPTSAYLRAFLQSPRPNAPIPPTPLNQTAAPSPSPFVPGMQNVPPYSPIPPVGSPYPFPFSHVRRSHVYSSSGNRGAPSSNYDPNHPSNIQEQIALQLQMYAMNNNRAMTESTLSPSSTPFPPPGYNPWAFLHANRAFGSRQQDPLSIQSSPSHEPVPLPLPPTTIRRRQRSSDLRQQATSKPPLRVESTQPRETSPEPSSSGEETAGDDRFGGRWMNGIVHDDSADWVDEETVGDEDDLLELEYHPTFVGNIEKRRRRWETRWEALMEAFEALDRQTDTTLVLFAAPSHMAKLYALTSRSLRRDASVARSPAMSHMRSAFSQIASRRRVARSRRSSLADRLLSSPGNSVAGSENSESREEDLKRALEAALGSLGVLGGIYEQREARWKEEMRRVSEERERVEMLLQQALGVGLTTTNENDTTGRAL